jgi:hypothetical protein
MIKFKGKVVYWADTDAKNEYEELRKIQIERAGLKLPRPTCVNVPPLKGHPEERYYDLLLFDWGGMSIGNSLLGTFCKYICEEAENCPSRYYVMVSQFTKNAMEDIMYEIGGEEYKPINVFLSLENFAEHLKKYVQ